MGRPRKDDVYKLDFSELRALPARIRAAGRTLEEQAGNGSRIVHGLDWQGEAKDGAGDRIDREQRQIRKLVDSGYEAWAKACEDGEKAMEPIRARLTPDGQALEKDNYDVSQNWDVTDKYDYEAGRTAMIRQGASEQDATNRMNQLKKDRENHAATEETRLQRLADELGVASDNMKNASAAARAEMNAAAPLAAGLTASEGKTDISDLPQELGAFNVGDPAALARLVAAGTLSPQQRAALDRGGKVDIDAGRMGYLYQLSQSLNGKSPEDIAMLTMNLPPDAKAALAQGLKMVSDPHVQVVGAEQIKGYAKGATDETRGSFVPVTGSLVNLPDGMVRELTRSDRVTAGPLINAPGGAQPSTVTLRGVGALQDIATVLSPGASISGSEATKSMLDAATQYATADIAHRGAGVGDVLNTDQRTWAGEHGGTAVGDTGVQHALSDVMRVAATDHVAVHDAASGAGGNDFMRALTAEHWDDKGGKIAGAFEWMGDPANTHNPMATETANAVAHYLGDPAHGVELKALPGGGTFGEVNPGISHAMADGIKPYLGQLAGLDTPHANGVTQFGSAEQMKTMFSVLDQNHDSAISINAAASAEYSKLLSDTAEHGLRGNELLTAGRLAGAMQAGALDSDLFSRETAQWQQAAHDKHTDQLIDNWKKALGFIPGSDKVLNIAELARGIDKAMTPGENPALIQGDQFMRTLIQSGGPAVNSSDYYATVLQGLIAANPAIAHDPALAPFMTGNQIDYTKIADPENGAKHTLPGWFENPSQSYFDRATQSYWKTQLDIGRDNTDWSH